MINIISKSVLNKKTRGPQKVVQNLIKGLKSIDYPFVLNRGLDSTDRLWIHDDQSALAQISSLPERVKVVVGPNLYVNPEEIPTEINWEKALYLQPSEVVKNIWRKRGFQTPLEVWPSGVDIEEFKPAGLPRENVLLYFKNREDGELENIESVLKEKGMKYNLIKYGQYHENDFKKILSTSKYIIWLGMAESQGLALLEAFSMNVPAVIIDRNETSLGEPLTAAPYFDDHCGIKINSFDEFSPVLNKMENEWQRFNPRDFVVQNLNLERQAHKFVDFFEDHFGLTVDQGKRERLQNDKRWRNDSWWFKALVKLKEAIK